MQRATASRFTWFPALGAALVLLVAVLAPATALAAQAHYFTGSIATSGSGAGQLALLPPELEEKEGQVGVHYHELTAAGSGLAVNEATGDVYVADTANHRVAEFDPSKAPAEQFIRAFGWGVGDGSPELQTCTTTCQAGIAGSEPGQLGAPTFIAVDNSPGGEGDLYVADSGDQLVTKFDSEGNLIESWGVKGQLDGSTATEQGPFSIFGRHFGGLAVDSVGHLLVMNGNGYVFTFDQAGAFSEVWQAERGGRPSGLAIDGAGNSFLANAFSQVEKIAPDGSRIGAVTLEAFAGGPAPTGLAADRLHNDLYVDEEGTSIGDFSPQCEPHKESNGASVFCSPAEVFGATHLTQAAGLALDSTTGTLYAANAGTNQIAVFSVGLEAQVEAATEVKATTATLHGQVDPKGRALTRCRFEYGETIEYGSEAPCEYEDSPGHTTTDPAAIPTGSGLVPVTAKVSALQSATKLHFRLRASRAPTNDEGNDVRSDDETLAETLPLPLIEEAAVSNLTATSATLNAKINPRGLATRYRFEYGPCATASTCSTSPYPSEVPQGGEDIGAGSADVAVSQPITGLSPNTTYHFRVSATSSNGTATSPEHTFVFLTEAIPQPETPCANEALREANGSLALPDCRAYELVTPARKNGALIGALFLGQVPPQISTDGSTVIVPSIQCFGGAQGCTASRFSEGVPFEFTRASSSWVTNPLAPPASAFQTSSWWGFDPDTHATLFTTPNSKEGEEWYSRRADGSFVDIGPFAEGASSFVDLNDRVYTTDLSHLVYVTSHPWWAFDEGAAIAISLYEYAGAGNSHPLLVGVSGGPESHDLIGTCGSQLGGGNENQAFGSLSADGRTVYFRAKPCSTGSGANVGKKAPVYELFARIDGEGPAAHTVAISQPQAEQITPTPPNDACLSDECEENTNNEANFRDAYFEGASNDGQRMFFTSTQQLTDDAGQDPSKSDSTVGAPTSGCAKTTGANGCNLYLYDFGAEAGHHLIDVSAGAKDTGGPRVQGSVAISPDGSHAYFVAKGVLTEAPNSQGQGAVEGAENLYLYQRDAAHPSGSIFFLTILAPSDKLWIGLGTNQGIDIPNVTPDGRFLVFPSHRALTSDATRSEGPAQIYRYDAATEQLTRVSIGRRGFNDDGNSGAGDASVVWAYKAYQLGAGPAKANPTMSDDGRFVFFESPIALTPRALDDVQVGIFNEVPEYAQNVYEWQAQGAGGCTEPTGCVSLLTNGNEVIEFGKVVEGTPELLGTDASGADVFLAAKDPLTWQDTDSQRDYYDLRVHGGFMPPTKPLSCAGDACKGEGTKAPAESSPATPAFNAPPEGPNFPQAPKCKKGQVKKSGKCVKKAKHHKKSKKKRAATNRSAAK